MPTPFEPERKSEFGVGHSPPRRSIFGNYNPPVAASRESAANIEQEAAALSRDTATLQASIDTALARTFIYRILAKAYEDPEPDGWQWLAGEPTKSAL